MNYYKIKNTIPVGEKLSQLFAEGRRCDDEANKMASSLKAISYLISSDADFGGIDAVEFPAGYMPSSTVWELIHNEEGLRSYVPKVEIKSEYLPVKQAESFRGKYGKIVSNQEVTLPSKGKCLPVMTVAGNRKAVQLYKRMQELPVVPAGSVAQLLGIKNSNTRPGMFEQDGFVYIQTKHPVSVEGIETILVDEFKRAVDKLKAQQGK